MDTASHKSNPYVKKTKRIKVNQSHYRPEVPGEFLEVKIPRLRTVAQNGGKVVSLTHRPLFTPQEMLLVLISVRS